MHFVSQRDSSVAKFFCLVKRTECPSLVMPGQLDCDDQVTRPTAIKLNATSQTYEGTFPSAGNNMITVSTFCTGN